MKTIRLRPGKERSLLRRHPWVFEGSVAGGKADAGETVRVEASDGRFLAWAAYSPQSSIRAARLELRRGRAHRRRVLRAPHRRRGGDARAPGRSRATACAWSTARPTACRGWSSIATATRSARSSSSAGAERWKAAIADALLEATGAARLYERSDTSARAARRAARRRPAGCAAARRRAPTERRRSASTTGASRSTSPSGHKTGFYLDQRDNRKLFADTRAPLRLRARAQLLLLHRRLQRRRAGRRRGAGDRRRFVGAGARARRGATSR